MIICDTDVIIELLKDRSPVVFQFQAIGWPNLSISAVTKGELIFGALNKTDLAFVLEKLFEVQFQAAETL